MINFVDEFIFIDPSFSRVSFSMNSKLAKNIEVVDS